MWLLVCVALNHPTSNFHPAAEALASANIVLVNDIKVVVLAAVLPEFLGLRPEIFTSRDVLLAIPNSRHLSRVLAATHGVNR